MRRIIVIGALALAGCGGARHGAAGADRCWPAGAFRIEALEHGTEWEPVFVVDAEGNVRRPGSRDVRAKFTHEADADVFTAFTMKDVVMRCTPDRVISSPGKPYKLQYEADDTLAEREFRVSIDRSGAVHIRDSLPLKARFVGDPGLRRAAVLVVALGLGL